MNAHFRLFIRLAAATAGLLLCWSAFAALPPDVGVYRPSEGIVYLDYTHDGKADRAVRFPQPPEYLLVADMNGDGFADFVTYRDGTWTADFNLDGVPDATWHFGGVAGDVPLVADVDGDGRPDLVIYRAGTWYVSTRRDGVADRRFRFGGQPSDIPLFADFACEGVATPVVYRDGDWLMYSPGNPPVVVASWGIAGDRPLVTDWDGDCRDDVGVYRDGIWYVLQRIIDSPAASIAILGAPGDMPVAGRLQRGVLTAKYRQLQTRHALYRPADGTILLPFASDDRPDVVLDAGADGVAVTADFDGDGSTDIAIYAGGEWRVDVDLDGRPDYVYRFGGEPGDVPLAADVDGDGIVDLVVYRKGAWYVSSGRTSALATIRNFGGVDGDQPLLADVNGDGRADVGVYRSGYWFFDTDGDGAADVVYTLGGEPQDRAFVADWDGDGHPDLGIFRDGGWYVSTAPSSGSASSLLFFGDVGDVPLAGKFVLKSSLPPVLFAPLRRPTASGAGELLGAIALDTNGDGWDDVLGGINDATGMLQGRKLTDIGLGSLFSPNRVNRDCRIADLTGDGVLDVVCNTYSAFDQLDSYARMFVGLGDGTFAEDPAFAALAIRGWGETIVAADFDNDGDVDLFLPFYSHTAQGEHSYLLRNDGSGHFVDVSDAAGVALRNVPAEHRVEGAQAVDYDDDGWIDLYVGGRLFRNNADGTFSDVTAAAGLPGTFDEGAKFTDWNNDGRLDLVIHHPTTGPTLWQFDGTRFVQRDVLPRYLLENAYGLNVGDLDGDGREDLVVAGGDRQTSSVLLNAGDRFVRDPLTLFDSMPVQLSTIADFDHDGRLDLYLTDSYGARIEARNVSPSASRQALTIDVVDVAGRHNQFGRVARIRPDAAPGVTMTRVVDGGSGLLSQTPYELTVPTPYAGVHHVTVRFAASAISFDMTPGQRMRVFADGRTQPY